MEKTGGEKTGVEKTLWVKDLAEEKPRGKDLGEKTGGDSTGHQRGSVFLNPSVLGKFRPPHHPPPIPGGSTPWPGLFWI